MRVQGYKLFLALLVCLLTGPSLAQAQDMSKAQQAELRRFAYNNSLFVLYHEVAHLVFDQLSLPVLGKEEDAADNMATWTLLKQRTAAAEQALTDSAQGWVLSGIAYNSGGDESDFAGAHSLDKQRAYQIVCMMVGMDDAAYRRIANQYRMDRDRQDSCFWEYETIDRSLKSLLTRSGKSKGSKVTVTYHDVSGPLKTAADAFRSSGVFDQVADELRKNYSLRQPVVFNAQRCGEANAFYDPDTVEVIFCYELMQDYMDLYAQHLTKEAAAAAAGQAVTKKKKTSKF